MVSHGRHLASVVGLAMASRIVTLALLVLASELLPTHDASGVHKFRPDKFPVPSGAGVGGYLAAFTRWDSAWFLSIASQGYPSTRTHDFSFIRDQRRLSCDVDSSTRSNYIDFIDDQSSCSTRSSSEEATDDGPRDVADTCGPPLQSWPRDVAVREQAHAFFPLFPWVVRSVANAVRASSFVGGTAESLVMAAVIVSNVFFIIAAATLYQLGLAVTRDSAHALQGAFVFCLGPASVFFSTAYTESLFAALTFAGLLLLFAESRRRLSMFDPRAAESSHVGSWSARVLSQGGKALRGVLFAWTSACVLSLATLTRSNGMTAVGVFVLEKVRWMAYEAGIASGLRHWVGELDNTKTKRRSAVLRSGDSHQTCTNAGGSTTAVEKRDAIRLKGFIWFRVFASAVATFLQALLIVAPYGFVQRNSYLSFCQDYSRYTYLVGGEIVDQLRPWCLWEIPSLYTYVQSTYWGVGAFRYYEWKQVPNFLLAAPVLCLTISGTCCYFSRHINGSPSSTLERSSESQERMIGQTRRVIAGLFARSANLFFGAPALPHPGAPPYERSSAAALVLHWAILGFFSVVCMNVQVATRFLAAACPALHWWTARCLFSSRGQGKLGFVQRALIGYILLFLVIGAAMHANFLPWT